MILLRNVGGGGGSAGYRSDIDGLRAVACVAVVLYHAFPKLMPGGFIGVDVFFVISGFLISSILYKNLFNQDNPGHVHIVDFYIRRVKRIFPALIFVLIFCLTAGWFILLPDEYKLLGKHTLGGATYISNFMLYFESGDYFAVDSRTKPLLHLWSLGVEEQFYIIFPLFLFVIYRLNLNFILCLALFSVLSFAQSRNLVNHGYQSMAFYMPWARFWELSLGAMLAYGCLYYKDAFTSLKDRLMLSRAMIVISGLFLRNNSAGARHNLLSNLISFTGLVAIITGYFIIRNDSSFPGTRALIPVLGALLIIAGGKSAFINRYLLSAKIMVFLGLISYPLYLWHWPLISFAYICQGQEPAVWVRAVCVAASLLLATFTFFFVEPPLRYGKHLKLKAICLFMVLLATGGMGALIYQNNGYVSRFDDREHAERDAKLQRLLDDSIKRCQQIFPDWKKYSDVNQCAFEKPDHENTIALIGDSHSRHLFFGLAEMFEKQKSEQGVAVFPVSCQTPFLDLQAASRNIPDKKISTARTMGHILHNEAYSYIFKEPKIKTVLLAHTPGCSFGDLIDLRNPEEKNVAVMLENGMRRTLDALRDHGKKVVLVLDNPGVEVPPDTCTDLRGSRVPFLKKPINPKCVIDRKRQEQFPFIAQYNSIARKVARDYDNVRLLNLFDMMCDEKTCKAVENSRVLFQDQVGHLNFDGSRYVAPKIWEFINEK